MAFDGPLAEAEIHACVAALRTATAGLEQISPRALSALARAALVTAMRGRGFTLPLDEVDAAARVCDPIFSGVRTGTNVHGKLLKDYCPVEW